MTVDSDLLSHDVRQLDKQPSAVLDTAVPSVHTIDRNSAVFICALLGLFKGKG
jgi:hypothetical protein